MNCHCGQPLPPYAGVGRPRKRCRECAANKSVLAKAWRVSHPDRVAIRNAARAKNPRTAQRWRDLALLYESRRAWALGRG